jgi:hypothetical protein
MKIKNESNNILMQNIVFDSMRTFGLRCYQLIVIFFLQILQKFVFPLFENVFIHLNSSDVFLESIAKMKVILIDDH